MRLQCSYLLAWSPAGQWHYRLYPRPGMATKEDAGGLQSKGMGREMLCRACQPQTPQVHRKHASEETPQRLNL